MSYINPSTLVGQRVLTAHGPTGRDTGIIETVVSVEPAREGGKVILHNDGSPVLTAWCDVRLCVCGEEVFAHEPGCSGAAGVMFLDYRTDGHGRIVLT